MALAGLRRYEEALTEYFQCYLLEETCSKFLKMEMVKVFHQLITARAEVPEEPQASPSRLVNFYCQSEKDSDSSDSEGQSEGEDNDDEVKRTRKLLEKNKKLLIQKNCRLTSVLTMIDVAVTRLVTNPPKLCPRPLDPAAADKDDVDCSLCFRLVWLLSSSQML